MLYSRFGYHRFISSNRFVLSWCFLIRCHTDLCLAISLAIKTVFLSLSLIFPVLSLSLLFAV